MKLDALGDRKDLGRAEGGKEYNQNIIWKKSVKSLKPNIMSNCHVMKKAYVYRNHIFILSIFQYTIYWDISTITKDLDSLKKNFKRKLEQNLYCKIWRSYFIPWNDILYINFLLKGTSIIKHSYKASALLS